MIEASSVHLKTNDLFCKISKMKKNLFRNLQQPWVCLRHSEEEDMEAPNPECGWKWKEKLDSILEWKNNSGLFALQTLPDLGRCSRCSRIWWSWPKRLESVRGSPQFRDCKESTWQSSWLYHRIAKTKTEGHLKASQPERSHPTGLMAVIPMFVDASAILKLVSGAVEVKGKFLAEIGKSLVSLLHLSCSKTSHPKLEAQLWKLAGEAFSNGLIREVKIILVSKSGRGAFTTRLRRWSRQPTGSSFRWLAFESC